MKTFQFYGVDCNRYKLDNVIWEAMEDESDGYRSYLGSIEVSKNEDSSIFFSESLAEVKIEKVETEDLKGWNLVDTKDNHVWLFVGTNHYDSYYPCFRFEYHPKPQKININWESWIV